MWSFFNPVETPNILWFWMSLVRLSKVCRKNNAKKIGHIQRVNASVPLMSLSTYMEAWWIQMSHESTLTCLRATSKQFLGIPINIIWFQKATFSNDNTTSSCIIGTGISIACSTCLASWLVERKPPSGGIKNTKWSRVGNASCFKRSRNWNVKGKDLKLFPLRFHCAAWYDVAKSIPEVWVSRRLVQDNPQLKNCLFFQKTSFSASTWTSIYILRCPIMSFLLNTSLFRPNTQPQRP